MGVGNYLENRLGLGSFLKDSLTDKHPPKGIGFLRTLGFAAMTVLVLQILSGIGLSFHYVPSAEHAYDSIRAMEAEVPYGAFVRSLHYFGASAFVILVFLHLCRVFFTGAYKAPREFTWLTGVGLFVLVLAFGFTGYLLPWDQKAYFATKVGTEIAGKAPFIGAQMKEILNGGESVGPPTLTRFYVIHVVLLPLGLLGLLGLHFYLIQRHGVSAPGRPVGDEGEPGPAYHPHHTFKEALVGVIVAVVLFWLAATNNAHLEAIAEPSDTGYQPRPDWYFYGLFELLKIFKGPLETIGTFWLPNLFLVGLVVLPFLDRNKERAWNKRPIMTTVGVITVIAIVVLTWMGGRNPPQNEEVAPYQLGLTAGEKHGYVMVRRMKCTQCHSLTLDGKNWGNPGRKVDKDNKKKATDLTEIEYDAETIAAIVKDPMKEIENDEMPAFDKLSFEDRVAIGLYIVRLSKKKD